MYQYGQHAMSPGMMGPGEHHHQSGHQHHQHHQHHRQQQPDGWRPPRGATQQYTTGQTQQYSTQWSEGRPYMMPGMHPGAQNPYTHHPQMMQALPGAPPGMTAALNATPPVGQDGMVPSAAARHGRQPQHQSQHPQHPQQHPQHPRGAGQRPPLFGAHPGMAQHPDFNPTGQPYGGPYNPMPDIYGNPMMQPVRTRVALISWRLLVSPKSLSGLRLTLRTTLLPL